MRRASAGSAGSPLPDHTRRAIGNAMPISRALGKMASTEAWMGADVFQPIAYVVVSASSEASTARPVPRFTRARVRTQSRSRRSIRVARALPAAIPPSTVASIVVKA